MTDRLAEQIRARARRLGAIRVAERVSELDEHGLHAQVSIDGGRILVYSLISTEDHVVDVWRNGYCWLSGVVPTLDTVIDLATAWDSGISLAVARRRWPALEYDELAAAHERGEAVEAQWGMLISDSSLVQMHDLLVASYARPRLRVLFPWVGHLGSRLGFSRCTGYPYTKDIPAIDLINEGFRVTDISAGIVLGQFDDFSKALDHVVQSIPDWVGPAVPGTADDIDPLPPSDPDR
ncbi:DUF6193 family natural product biosynthesis protein [Actinomadura sp. NPDC000600]|uniref:DUF6193 family natural product biosynthesis protein n=1 Tax=Actinomadura sp. NPDC000600 TaxID=3154262 RepID=UPI0033961787